MRIILHQGDDIKGVTKIKVRAIDGKDAYTPYIEIFQKGGCADLVSTHPLHNIKKIKDE